MRWLFVSDTGVVSLAAAILSICSVFEALTATSERSDTRLVVGVAADNLLVKVSRNLA